ncbi:hypothetical protein ACLB2K_069228 [Fragaria x ananassa]
MCAIREWFDTFEESSSGEVFRGDDSPCRILGIGSVKIRMHDGVVRKPENVKYIPKLRKNLISLGTLDKVRYRYSSKEGRLKVIKGSLVVMKGDIQPNNVYKLQGTTIIGGVAMSAEVNDKTEQWQQGLRRMSQRGMQKLYKDSKAEGVSVCKLNFCKDGTLGKHKVAFKLVDCENKSKRLLDYIHSEVWSATQVLDFKCAEEIWSKEPAGYSNLRMFGSSAYAHILSNEQTKLKPNFLGVEKGVKGYKLWNIVSKKKVLSRYVIDDKTVLFNEVKTSEVKTKTDVGFVDEATEVPLTKEIMEETPAQVEHDKGVIEEFQRSIALDKYALSFSSGDPTMYQEAIAKYIRESWMRAMLEQKKKSIPKDLVQESVPKPKEGNLVGCKWVYRKREEMHDKEAMSCKAWVLAKEYAHKEKVNYDKVSLAEICVYHHVFKDSVILLSGDVLTTCQDVSRIPKLKTQLRREFDMKGLEAAQQILEVKVRRDREAGKLWLLTEPMSTPPVAHFQFSVQGGSSIVELDEMMHVSYARVVGCLMARIFKRPGLTQGLSIVSKYVVNPGRRYWQAATWILYYLRNTKEHEFLFERQQEQACIAGHERSDLARDLDKGRSATSNVFTCSKASGSCRTTMESAEILSTTKVDCMAVAEAFAEALWLNGLISKFGIQQEAVVKNGVINLTRNQVFQAESEHVDVCGHCSEGPLPGRSSSIAWTSSVSQLAELWWSASSLEVRQGKLTLAKVKVLGGMNVTSVLIIWKALMCFTGSESPVVVVFSGSMEPGFRRFFGGHLDLQCLDQGFTATTTTTTTHGLRFEEEEGAQYLSGLEDRMPFLQMLQSIVSLLISLQKSQAFNRC